MRTKKLKDIWDKLPDIEHTRKYIDEKSGLRMYEVIGKKFQETAGVEYVLDILKKTEEIYGKRARLAAENVGIDHKAVSHALRAAYQVRELLTTNTIVFPLKQAEFLKEVKLGKLNYIAEVAPKLEALMDEVEILSQNSTLPEKADVEFWNGFIIAAMEGWI